MILCEVNKYEDVWRVITKDNKTLFKGTKKECRSYMNKQSIKNFNKHVAQNYSELDISED